MGFLSHFSRAHHKMLPLQTIPVERTRDHDLLGKVRGKKDQPTGRGMHALTHDFWTLTREKCHGSSRPDPHETRISRVTRIVAGRVGSGQVGSGQDVSKFSRVGSGRVSGPNSTRPDPRDLTRTVKSPGKYEGFSRAMTRPAGRVTRFSKPHGSGRVGSGPVGSTWF